MDNLKKNLLQKTQKNKAGFTMIEFMLVTATIAVVLIVIAMLINHISAIYQKGLTLKAVNSVGRGLVDELTGGINAAPSIDTISLCKSHVGKNMPDAEAKDLREQCIQNKAWNFIFQERIGDLVLADGTTASIQLGGIFCTGHFSYIWNTFYAFKNGNKISIRYRDAGGAAQPDKDDFRLIRIEDPTYRVCSAKTSDANESKLQDEPVIDITTLANGSTNNLTSDPVQGFLRGFDLDLSLYELTIFPIAQSQTTFRSFFAGSFTLATDAGNPQITRTADYCDIESISGTDTSSNLLDVGNIFNYCGINKFNFAARTAGKGGIINL